MFRCPDLRVSLSTSSLPPPVVPPPACKRRLRPGRRLALSRNTRIRTAADSIRSRTACRRTRYPPTCAAVRASGPRGSSSWERTASCRWRCEGGGGGIVNNKRNRWRFGLNGLIGPEATQDEVFETVAAGRRLRDRGLQRRFAYGQTGSGKTFTPAGGVSSYNERGIIPRALSALYAHINGQSEMEYTVHLVPREALQRGGLTSSTRASRARARTAAAAASWGASPP